MIVAATNANGEPDFFFLIVQGSDYAYTNGDFYDRAKRAALDNDYEGPMVAFDENDAALKAILSHFQWDSATVYEIAS